MAIFHSIKPTTRLLIIHPNYQQQKPLLANLLFSEQVVYVRFDGENLTVDDLNEQIYDAYQKMDTQDMNLVILDECDRAKKGDFDDFLYDLAQHIQPTPIVLFSRQFPYSIFDNSFLRSIIEIWPVDNNLMLPNYATKRDSIVLEVFSFGQGYIRINGEWLENWPDLLSRRLFFFLVDKEYVHREEIFDTFWPNLSIDNAASAFQVTKSDINSRLGQEITEFRDGYHSIHSRIDLYYSVKQYHELIERGDYAQGKIADTLFRQASSLYWGDFLRGYDMAWVQNRRKILQEKQANVLANIGKIHGISEHDEAIVYYGRAASLDPKREDIAHELIRLYLQMGMPCEALSAYNNLHHELSISIGIEPSTILKILAEEANQQCLKD